ncbi:ABC transporter permease [Candidatus Lokiarchaeum ossiferum]|uniref:ABC transporter permease n=1 Tax=Candidatus Lokiarchaeum ossiferum TaxID=2951803 RepID=UPI00352E68CF
MELNNLPEAQADQTGDQTLNPKPSHAAKNKAKPQKNKTLNASKHLIHLKNRVSRIHSLIKKEISVLLRDKVAIILLLVLPTSVILLTHFMNGDQNVNANVGSGENAMGSMGFTFSVPKIGIIDRDNSDGYYGADLSAQFAQNFEILEENDQCVLIRGYTQNEYEQMLGEGTLNGYIVINTGFEYNLSTHFVAMFDIFVDSYDQFVMQDVFNVVDNAVSLLKTDFNFTGAISINTDYVNVPETAGGLRSISAFFYPLLVMALPILIQSQSLIGDLPKDRMVLTPTNKGEILLSKYMGGIIVNSSLSFVVTFVSIGLGLKADAGWFVYLMLMIITVIMAISFGLLISAISKTSLQGFQYALIVIIMQEMLMLFISNDNFLSVFPLYCVQELYRVGVLKGIPLFSLTNSIGVPYLVILLIEIIMLVGLSYLFYKKSRSVI